MGEVGISAVAELAGVSVGTVSNFLNRPQVVAVATADRIKQAIEELGYVRNSSARDLRMGKARSIGLLVLDIGNPFFTEFVEGVEEVANAAGLAVMLGNTKEDPAKEASYLELFQEQRVSGIIMAPIGDVRAQLTGLRRHGTPAVLIDDGTELGDFCSVAVDGASGGAMAIEHLLATGRRRILILAGPQRIHQARARITGALARAADLGVTPELVEVESFSADAAHQAVRALIEGQRPGERFDGIFASNDIMALGAMQALHEGGGTIPGDVGIIGYDDISYAAALSPSLTSIKQPSRELGREAMSLLLKESEGDPEHRHRRSTFKPALRPRQST